MAIVIRLVFVVSFVMMASLSGAPAHGEMESRRSPSLLEFQAKLLTAAESRDIDFIDSIADMDKITGFGLSSIGEWFNYDDTWEALITALEYGGNIHVSNGAMIYWTEECPNAWPKHDGLKIVDPSDFYVVPYENVPVYKSPFPNAEVIGVIGFISVYSHYDAMLKNTKGYVGIRTAGGVIGFVESHLVCTPMGHRFEFGVVNGRWRLLGVYAGD